MKFGDYLRQSRDKMKWTQPEAAKKIEIEQSYLSKLETGKSLPSEEIFEKLVDVLNINIEDLFEKISNDELGKLKDIKQVKEAVLKLNQTKVKATRSWLVAGFVMIVLFGGFLAATILPIYEETQFIYRSEGVLQPTEELGIFNLIYSEAALLDHEDQNKRTELLSRISQIDEVTNQYKGDAYVESTPKGRRYYQLIGQKERHRNFSNRWFIVPALMFFLGGISSFYISRRWN